MVWSQKIAVVVAWLCEREWERLFTFMRRWAPLFRRRQAGTVVDDERRKERLFVVVLSLVIKAFGKSCRYFLHVVL